MPASVPLVVHELVDASNAVHDAAKVSLELASRARPAAR